MNAMKRFYKKAEVAESGGIYEVRLDGRAVRTPSKERLGLPNAALASAIAEEWNEQDETIDPEQLPLTRRAGVAIDYIAPNRSEAVDEIARFGETDLLCYRVKNPSRLRCLQEELWQPFLDWARDKHGIELRTTEGLLPVAQPEAEIAKIRGIIEGQTPYVLAGLHGAVCETGSIILGLALLDGRCDAPTAWQVSQVEEEYQTENWGAVEMAKQRQERRRREIIDSVKFMQLAQNIS